MDLSSIPMEPDDCECVDVNLSRSADEEAQSVNSEGAVQPGNWHIANLESDIDAFYDNVKDSLGSFHGNSSSETVVGDSSDGGNRGSVASDSTMLTEDLSRASTQVTQNKSSVTIESEENHTFYDPPLLRKVRALERVRESEEELPSWAVEPVSSELHQQHLNSSSTARASFKRSRRENRILFVLGLIALVFFGLCCGLIIVLLTQKADNNTNNGRYGTTSGLYSDTLGVARVVDDDFAPSGSPTSPPQQADDPLLSSLRKPTTSCQPNYSPPPLLGKKGIGFTLRQQTEEGSWKENIPKIIAVDPYWSYSWSLERSVHQPDHIEFIPMVWGGYNEHQLRERLEEYVLPQIEIGTVKRLLGFNEPDYVRQSNMEVEQAIHLWSDLENVGLPLASPSCAHPGKQWMRDFMEQASQDCLRIDYVGVHWYGKPDFWGFRSKMISYYRLYNRPLLITEFAPVNWNATNPGEEEYPTEVVLEFMKKALPWLEEQSWIAGYAWFPFESTQHPGSTSALFQSDGNLTDCGRYYASVRNDDPLGNQAIGLVATTHLRDFGPDQCTEYPSPPPLPGKRGVALPMRPEGMVGSWVTGLPKLFQLAPYWYHSWSRKSVPEHPRNMEFVPMIWGAGGSLDSNLEEHVVPSIETGETKRLLTFQTPGTSHGSDLSVDRALSEWPKLEKLGIPLVSPSGTAKDPWLSNFMSNVTALCMRVDWIAAHYYGPADVATLQANMQSIHEKYERPIIITEMAVTDASATTVQENRFTATDVLDFMKEALPWLEEQEWIAGYAWFSFSESDPRGAPSALFDENYDLTDIGEYYSSVTTQNIFGNR